MKKTLLSILCVLFAFTLSAQLQNKLVRYSDDSNYEYSEFFYSQDNQLVAIREVIAGEYEVYDSVKYDNNGNIIKLCGWQLFGRNLKFVNYVDYTYDAQNRITSRTNYNKFDDEFELGGVYTYSYDAQGHHNRTVLTMGGQTVQTIDYTYEGDLLKEEYWTLYGDPSEKLTYYYDANNRLISHQDSTYEGGRWKKYASHEFTYDSLGNRLTHIGYDDSGNISEKHIYTYSDMLLSETLMPFTPETVKPADTEGNRNVYTTEEYWGLDANFVLQHICDYTYTYVGIHESPVENVTAVQQIRDIRKVVIDGRIYIETGNAMYDLNGRRIR